MTFFKTEGHDIVTLIVYQIAMKIFGLVTLFATTSIEWLNIASSILGIGLYFYITYTLLWEKGGKDRVRVDAGRFEKNMLKPVYMSLSANIPNFFFGLLWITQFIPGSFFKTLSDIGRILSLGLQGYYLGVGKALGLLANPFVFLALPLFIVGVAFLGYAAGYAGFRIFPQNKKERESQTK